VAERPRRTAASVITPALKGEHRPAHPLFERQAKAGDRGVAGGRALAWWSVECSSLRVLAATKVLNAPWESPPQAEPA